jgi:hypothetical protein
MAKRTDRKHRSNKVEFKDFHLYGGLGEHIRNGGELFAQELHGGGVIRASGQLALQFNPPERIGGEVLDDIAENLCVSNHHIDVVRSIDSRNEQANLLDRPRYPSDRHEITYLEGS